MWHRRVDSVVDGIDHLLATLAVSPIGIVGVIVHVPEETVGPDSPSLLLEPLEHGVHVVGVEVVVVVLPVPPLHRVLGHREVEVVPGEGAVGVVVAVVPAAGYFVGLQGGTYKVDEMLNGLFGFI